MTKHLAYSELINLTWNIIYYGTASYQKNINKKIKDPVELLEEMQNDAKKIKQLLLKKYKADKHNTR